MDYTENEKDKCNWKKEMEEQDDENLEIWVGACRLQS